MSNIKSRDAYTRLSASANSMQKLTVSEGSGSDSYGDGVLYPYATVNKALAVAAARSWTKPHIELDATCISSQNVTLGASKSVFISGPGYLGTITVGNSSSLELNVLGVNLITSDVDENECCINIYHGQVEDIANYAGWSIQLFGTILNDVASATIETKIQGTTWMGGYYALYSEGGHLTIIAPPE